MIKSMTGYGKGRSSGKMGTVAVEIRTVNHKYFDLVLRLPNHLSVLEDKVREYVKKKIRRGRINLSASLDSKDQPQDMLALNIHLAKRYQRELFKLKRSLKLHNDLSLAQFVSLPDIITYANKKEKAAELWPDLRKALDRALNKLIEMRQAEGRRLAEDLQKRTRRTLRLLENIEQHLPKVINRYRENLLKKVKALSGIKATDQDRIAEEVALFVRNSDVSEELTRMQSHLKAFRQALRNQKEAGKELDFIAQELFRETNTIGAKASSFKISRCVIKMKSQIEKMREQLQNVE